MRKSMLWRLLRLIILFLFHITVTSGLQCPNLKDKCRCSTNTFGATVVCSGAKSLEDILNILSTVQTPLHELIITETLISEIPDFAFRNLTFEKISLLGTGITKIHTNAFAGPLLDSLQVLEISNGKLRTVDQPGISILRNLHTLILRDNSITTLSPNAFSNYKRSVLRNLDLSTNQISQIDNYAFYGLDNLHFLDITKNALTLIPTDALKALPSLESLQLSVNEIKRVPADALPLPNLKIVSLETNLITEISVDAFRQNPQLTALYLNDNLLTQIEPQIFQPTPQLRILTLGSNKMITGITKSALNYLGNLFQLDLSGCSISTIEDGAFQQLRQLQIIDLSKNRLKEIHRIFAGLQYLTTIDLSDNYINEVKIFAFSDLPSVNHLDLSNNRLATLPRTTLQGTLQPTWPPTTREFYLYGNPWNCNHELQWLKNWLSENENVHITAPGQQPPRCQEPPSLRGFDLRNAVFLEQHSRNLVPSTNIMPTQVKQEKGQNSNDGNFLPIRKTAKGLASGSFSDVLQEKTLENWRYLPEALKNKFYTSSNPYDVLLETTTEREHPTDDGDTEAAIVALVILLTLSAVGICGIVLLVIWYRMKRRRVRRGRFFDRDMSASTVSGACSTYIYNKDPWFRREYRYRKKPRSFLHKTLGKWF